MTAGSTLLSNAAASSRSLASLQALATASMIDKQAATASERLKLEPASLESILPTLNGPVAVAISSAALLVTCAAVGGSAALSPGMMSTIARTVSAPSVAASLSSLAVGDHLHATQSVMSTMQQLAVAQQLHQQQQQQQQQATSAIRLNPVLGVAPLGPQPLDRLHIFQLEMLESAARHLPHPSDSQRIRTHFPYSSCIVPAYQYHLPPSVWDSLDFYSRLDIDTLFFVFYYMEGTKAQYMAAKTLKLKSWRFHTKLLMWFQRHDEPTLITEDFEQGSYWFFDFESWTRRKQDNFTFEYRYLEDHDLK